MRHYAITGNPLEHSFSPAFFTQLFEQLKIDADYIKLPLQTIDRIREYDLDGFNVTCPYKQTIIKYLDYTDPVARQIGAVNTVKRTRTEKGYILTGYNTDCTGFKNAVLPLIVNREQDLKALILGTGGAARAVAYALKEMNIKSLFVSRNPDKGITYGSLDETIMSSHKIIINATPLGMHPLENIMPDIPYEYLTTSHIVYDCIYNPSETLFLKRAKQAGAKTENGLNMLICQAKAAWQIWNQ